jgi:hypothetical protein
MARISKWQKIAQEKAEVLRANLSHEGISELAFLYGRAYDQSRTVGGNTKDIFLQKKNQRKSYDLTQVPTQYQTYFCGKVAYEMTERGMYPSQTSQKLNPEAEEFFAKSLDTMVAEEDLRHLDSQEEIPLTRDHARSW